MARTQSVSDEAILEAARRVIMRSGYDAFTLSEVAQEVGLSRAAIILRFQSTHALRVTLTSRMVANFAAKLEALPITKGGDGLIELARFIGSLIKGQCAVVSFMSRLRESVADPELAVIEERRINAYDTAVSIRMPKTVLSHESAVMAFQAHLGGCLLRLENRPDIDAAAFLEERTKEWLTLARIPFTVRAPKAVKRADARGPIAKPASRRKAK